MARTTVLSDELRERVCELIEAPLPIHQAAIAAGISKTTHYRWMQYGEEDATPDDDWPKNLEPYREYREAVTRARAIAMGKLVEPIVRRAQGGEITVTDKQGKERRIEWDNDWRAAAWLAERMFPDELGPRQKLDHSGIAAAPVSVVPVLSEEAQDAARDFLRIAGGS